MKNFLLRSVYFIPNGSLIRFDSSSQDKSAFEFLHQLCGTTFYLFFFFSKKRKRVAQVVVSRKKVELSISKIYKFSYFCFLYLFFFCDLISVLRNKKSDIFPPFFCIFLKAFFLKILYFRYTFISFNIIFYHPRFPFFYIFLFVCFFALVMNFMCVTFFFLQEFLLANKING